jgi:hypothetical protein
LPFFLVVTRKQFFTLVTDGRRSWLDQASWANRKNPDTEGIPVAASDNRGQDLEGAAEAEGGSAQMRGAQAASHRAAWQAAWSARCDVAAAAAEGNICCGDAAATVKRGSSVTNATTTTTPIDTNTNNHARRITTTATKKKKAIIGIIGTAPRREKTTPHDCFSTRRASASQRSILHDRRRTSHGTSTTRGSTISENQRCTC